MLRPTSSASLLLSLSAASLFSHPAHSQPAPDLSIPRTLQEAGLLLSPAASTQSPIAQSPIAQSPIAPAPDAPGFDPITPQFGASFHTGPGTGYESSFGSVQGFLPLRQTPGRSLTFLQGRFNLSTAGGDPSGTLLFGYRQFNAPSNRIFGGYLGLDARHTGRASFSQIGLGLEALSPTWEVRLNGYIPLGDRQAQVAQRRIEVPGGTPTQAFQGNFLALTLPGGERRTTRVFETSLGGFDLEAGTRLTQWNRGDLRGYLGLYYYGGADVSALGVRGRLEAKITENLRSGLVVQHDPEFGTTAVMSVGVLFPGTRSRSTHPAQQLWSRMGESPDRQPQVAVTTRTQTEVVRLDARTELATNPATGRPWFFQHVTGGASGGDGTFERPLGQVEPTTVPTDGNGIVYVQAGSNPGLNGFVIPDNVQVWSSGVSQSLATTRGVIPLPGSGSGVLPIVTNTVTMGNNTGLSGFEITPPSGSSGVVATNVQTVEIRDNRVQAIADFIPAISLQEVTGTATIRNNQVQLTGNGSETVVGAIEVAAAGTALTTLEIANNTVTVTGDFLYGIVINPSQAGSIATATVANNTITTSGNSSSAVLVNPFDGGSIATATIANNNIATRGIGSDGIEIAPALNSPIATLSIANNTIATRGERGDGIALEPFESSISTATVSNNTITTSGIVAIGINLSLPLNSSIATATVSNNTINTTGTTAFGIYVAPSNNSSIATATVSNNTINTTGANSQGISVIPTNNSSIATATVSNNTITAIGNNSFGIYVVPFSVSSVDALTLSNNRILQSTADNVAVEANGNRPICVTITGNLAQNPGAGRVNFNLSSSGQPFRVVNLSTLSVDNNSGTFQFDGATTPAAPFANVAGCP